MEERGESNCGLELSIVVSEFRPVRSDNDERYIGGSLKFYGTKLKPKFNGTYEIVSCRCPRVVEWTRQRIINIRVTTQDIIPR